MKRLLQPLALLALLLLSGCAPAPVTGPPATAQTTQAAAGQTYPFQADFSDAGVTWVAGGRAYIARAPGFMVTPSPLPTPAIAASWVGNVAWAALSGVGLVITLDGAVQQLHVPQAWKLSHTRIYATSGAALGYSGAALSGFPFRPQAVLTAASGQDYALYDGHIYQNAAPLPVLLPQSEPLQTEALKVSCAGGPYLYATPTGAAQAACPTLQTQQGLYRLGGGELQQLSSAGAVLRRVPYPMPAGLQAALGQVGSYLVTLRSDGQLRAFMPDLREVSPQ